MKDEYLRNHEIRELLDIWEWCSRTLHVKWNRKSKHRNTCLIGLALAVNESRLGTEIAVLDLPQVYRSLPPPLFDEAGLLAFWNACPTSLLEMALGCFTQGSPLAERLDQLRLLHQDNTPLDKLFKKMTSREERYGEEWPMEGHHPQSEFVQLKKEMTPLCNAVKQLILREHAAFETLAQETLAQGPWQTGSLPATSFVRKTPESLLSRSVRLKLWRVAQEIHSQGLDDDRERLQALCNGLYRAITPSVKAAIESQGYTAEIVVDEVEPHGKRGDDPANDDIGDDGPDQLADACAAPAGPHDDGRREDEVADEPQLLAEVFNHRLQSGNEVANGHATFLAGGAG